MADFEDDNNLELSEIQNDLYLEDNLLETHEPGPRIFYMSNDMHTTLLGFVLSETADSFLVALPSRLVKSEEDGSLKIEPFIDVPFLRVVKSNVIMVMHLFGEFLVPFNEYLEKEGAERYPSITEQIELYLGDFSDKQKAKQAAPSKEQTEALRIEEEELAKKIEEAESRGSVIRTLGPSKH